LPTCYPCGNPKFSGGGEIAVCLGRLNSGSERLAQLVRREMEGVYQLEVPLEVSMATGRSWAEAQH
jgi:hypothetical protein